MTIIESTARAICVADGEDPGAIGYPVRDYRKPVPDVAIPRWAFYRQHAVAGLTALLEAELTPLMEDAYWRPSIAEMAEGKQAQTRFRAILRAIREQKT